MPDYMCAIPKFTAIMREMPRRFLKPMSWIFAALLGPQFVIATTNAAPTITDYVEKNSLFQNLKGHWMGWGWVEVASGDRERMRCVVTYRMGNNQDEASQDLRCASATYVFDATADLKNKDGEISGKWRETSYAAEGTITGRATSKFMSVQLLGDNLSVGMSISSRGECNQSVRIHPKGTDIKTMSVSLKRC